MCSPGPGFYVYKRHNFTVVGFDGRMLNDPLHAVEARDRLIELADLRGCQVLAVDLQGVDILSSWILGVLAAIKSRGVDVQLYHPSPEVNHVLRVTHLDELLPVRHGYADNTVAA